MTTFNRSIGALIICATGAVSACAAPVDDSQDEEEQVATAEQAIEYPFLEGSPKQTPTVNGHTCRVSAGYGAYDSYGYSGNRFASGLGYGFVVAGAKIVSGASANACLGQVRAKCCSMAGPCTFVYSSVSWANDANSGTTQANCNSTYPIATEGAIRAGLWGIPFKVTTSPGVHVSPSAPCRTMPHPSDERCEILFA